VLYYAYIAWAYYREDIREWLSTRGQKPEPASSPVDEPEDEEVDERSLYNVQTYDSVSPSVSTPVAPQPQQPAPVETVVAPAATQTLLADQAVPTDSPDEFNFELTGTIEPLKPTERSLSKVIKAAQGLKVDQQGRLLADENAGSESKELASTLNEQNGFGALLDGINFNR
jgi:hypothetical protein